MIALAVPGPGSQLWRSTSVPPYRGPAQALLGKEPC